MSCCCCAGTAAASAGASLCSFCCCWFRGLGFQPPLVLSQCLQYHPQQTKPQWAGPAKHAHSHVWEGAMAHRWRGKGALAWVRDAGPVVCSGAWSCGTRTGAKSCSTCCHGGWHAGWSLGGTNLDGPLRARIWVWGPPRPPPIELTIRLIIKPTPACMGGGAMECLVQARNRGTHAWNALCRQETE